MMPQSESPLVLEARARLSRAHADLIDAVVRLPGAVDDSRMVTPEVGAAMKGLQTAKRALDMLERRPQAESARGS